jgi:hypothetical protein
VVSQLTGCRWCRAIEQAPALLSGQPVSETNADPPYALHAADTRRQFRTQEPRVGRLVRDAPNGGQPKIDRGRRISALFEVNPISEHDGAVEGEAWF